MSNFKKITVAVAATAALSAGAVGAAAEHQVDGAKANGLSVVQKHESKANGLAANGL